MVMNDLSIIVRQMRVFSERKLHFLDIGFPEQIVLMFLTSHENVNQDQIAKHYAIDKGAIAKTIGKLEEKGYITRSENPDDKREKRILLTEQANKSIQCMHEVLDDWYSVIYSQISDEDIRRFEDTIGKIAANLLQYNSKTV